MFGNIKDMMAKLQEAQGQAQEMKSRLEEVQIRESQQGISLIVNGNRKIVDLKIEPSLLSEAEELEDLLLSTLNKALDKAENLHDTEMKKMAKGMMPGMDLFK